MRVLSCRGIQQRAYKYVSCPLPARRRTASGRGRVPECGACADRGACASGDVGGDNRQQDPDRHTQSGKDTRRVIFSRGAADGGRLRRVTAVAEATLAIPAAPFRHTDCGFLDALTRFPTLKSACAKKMVALKRRI